LNERHDYCDATQIFYPEIAPAEITVKILQLIKPLPKHITNTDKIMLRCAKRQYSMVVTMLIPTSDAHRRPRLFQENINLYGTKFVTDLLIENHYYRRLGLGTLIVNTIIKARQSQTDRDTDVVSVHAPHANPDRLSDPKPFWRRFGFVFPENSDHGKARIDDLKLNDSWMRTLEISDQWSGKVQG
jgi:hypothetical protein